MRKFTLNNAVLQVRTDLDDSEFTSYKIIEERRRFSVFQNAKGNKFFIRVGYRDNQRSDIICKDVGELVIALAIVRTAFPTD